MSKWAFGPVVFNFANGSFDHAYFSAFNDAFHIAQYSSCDITVDVSFWVLYSDYKFSSNHGDLFYIKRFCYQVHFH